MPKFQYTGLEPITLYGQKYVGTVEPGQEVDFSDEELPPSGSFVSLENPVANAEFLVGQKLGEVGSSPPAPTSDNTATTDEE